MSEEIIKKQPEEKKPSVADMEVEMKRLELEAKRLEVLERQANLQDAKERLEERALRREQRSQRSVTNGQTLKALNEGDNAAQTRCNHRKGGNGQEGIVGGQGDDSQYAVLKHTMLNGDTWIRCMRCAKTWKPPLEDNFYFDEQGTWWPPSSDAHGAVSPPLKGKFSQEKFSEAQAKYQEALRFQTKNKPSSSYVFKYSDGGRFYRQVTNNATLR